MNFSVRLAAGAAGAVAGVVGRLIGVFGLRRPAEHRNISSLACSTCDRTGCRFLMLAFGVNVPSGTRARAIIDVDMSDVLWV